MVLNRGCVWTPCGQAKVAGDKESSNACCANKMAGFPSKLTFTIATVVEMKEKNAGAEICIVQVLHRHLKQFLHSPPGVLPTGNALPVKFSAVAYGRFVRVKFSVPTLNIGRNVV